MVVEQSVIVKDWALVVVANEGLLSFLSRMVSETVVVLVCPPSSVACGQRTQVRWKGKSNQERE